MKLIAPIASIALFAAASSLFFGCEKVDQTVDCASICTRYKDCFDDSYDNAACTERCMDDAEADEDYADKADACEACMDDESCAGATFECAGNCLGIVP